MKRISGFLVFVMLLTMVVVPQTSVFAASEAELLEGRVIRESLEFNTNGDLEGGTVTNAASGVANGKLTVANGDTYTLSQSLNFTEGEIIHWRAQFQGASTIQLYSNNIRLRLAITGSSSSVTTTTLSERPDGVNAHYSFKGYKYIEGRTYDWMIYNREDGFEVWIQEEQGGYVLLGSGNGKWQETQKDALTIKSGSGNLVMDFLRIYKIADTTLLDGRVLRESLEFDTAGNLEGGSVTNAASVVSGGKLTVAKGDTYTNTTGIKFAEGDVALWRATYQGPSTLQLWSGGTRLRIAVNGTTSMSFAQCPGGVNGHATFQNYKYTVGNTYDWLVFNRAEGYELWIQENDTGFRYVGIGDGKYNGSNETTFTVKGNDSTTYAMDFFRVYCFSETDLLDGRVLRKELNFDTAGDLEGGKVTNSASTVADGWLTVKSGDAYRQNHAFNFKTDEAVRIRFRYKGTAAFAIAGNGTRMRIATNDNGRTYIAQTDGHLEIASTIYTADKIYDWLIFQREECYELWISEEGKGFYYVGKGTGKAANTGLEFALTASGSKDFIVDYVKIYGRPEVVTTEKGILGCGVLNDSLEFDQSGETGLESGSVSGGYTIANGALTLQSGSTYTLAKDFAFQRGDVIHARFRYQGAIRLSVYSNGAQMQISTDDAGYRTSIMHAPNGTNASKYFEGMVYTSGKTYDWLIVNKKDHFEFWAQEDSGGYYCLGVSEGKCISSSKQIVLANNGAGGGTPIDFVRFYKSSDLLDGKDFDNPSVNLDVDDDFNNMSGTGSPYSVKNGILSIGPVTETVEVQSTEAPRFGVGDVLALRVTPKVGKLVVGVNDGGRCRMDIEVGRPLLVYNATMNNTFSNLTFEANKSYDLIFENKTEGYGIWARKDDEVDYTYIGTTDGKREIPWETVGVRFYMVSGGSADVDYLRIYDGVQSQEDLLSEVNPIPSLSADTKEEFTPICGADCIISDDGIVTMDPSQVVTGYGYGLACGVNDTDFVVGGAVHVRFAPMFGQFIFAINERGVRFRIQNNTTYNCLEAYQENGEAIYKDFPIKYGTFYDIIALNKAEGFELWGKEADAEYYIYIGMTNGKRDDYKQPDDLLRFTVSNAHMKIDSFAIYDPIDPEVEDLPKLGLSFTSDNSYRSKTALEVAPRTFEATVRFPKSTYASLRGGVLLGNYGDVAAENGSISFEVHTNGNPRLHFVNENGTEESILFDQVNLYNGEETHLAVVIDTAEVRCFVNGVLKQTVAEAVTPVVYTAPMSLGGDSRLGNINFCLGRIKDAAIYSDVRTATEIQTDATQYGTDGLLCLYQLPDSDEVQMSVADMSGNGHDMVRAYEWGVDRDPVDDYDFSIAVLGDPQLLNLCWPESFNGIFDWVTENAESKKMKMLIGVGDITNNNTDEEWIRAVNGYQKISDIGLPYTLIRGNHDGNADPTDPQFNEYFNIPSYTSQIDGQYDATINNTYRTFTIDGIHFLLLCIDFAPHDDVLEWAGEVIEAHPNHNVIITTHGYLNSDGTTLDINDEHHPTKYTPVSGPGYNNGDDIWEKLASQYDNVVAVLSGHVHSPQLVTTYDTGIHGNKVAQMLIDTQAMDFGNYFGGTGIVTMLYFSEGGRKVQTETFSTVRNKYFRTSNQYDIQYNLIAGPLRATVPEGSGGKLIFAAFDKNGCLVKSQVDTITAKEEAQTYDFDLTDEELTNCSLIKAFLWEDFIGMEANGEFEPKVLMERVVQ